MTINTEQLKRECAAFGIELTEQAAERFDIYAATLIKWNAKMNLTAITEPSAVVTRHFVDSLTVLPCLSPNEGASLIDVGSGAGFPGLALKIARPDLNITLLDGTMKRITFLQEAANRMGLAVNAVRTRRGSGPPPRTARAV
jgi:16S rRNA (guanine(527)-N(7))-methyltransferase RsmG